ATAGELAVEARYVASERGVLDGQLQIAEAQRQQLLIGQAGPFGAGPLGAAPFGAGPFGGGGLRAGGWRAGRGLRLAAAASAHNASVSRRRHGCLDDLRSEGRGPFGLNPCRA